jgi:small-conductance mechanosensitive channel
MAVNMDLSPLQRFLRGVAGESTPGDYAWQAGAAVAAFGLAWLFARLMCTRLRPSARWKFGEGDFERVAFPLFAYLFLSIAVAVLSQYQRVASLEIVRSIVLAAAVIRLAVYVLGHILPEGAFLRIAVRGIAWIAWIAVILHVTGLLDETIAALDRVGFTSGKGQRISLWLLLQGAAALGLALTIAMWLARTMETRVMSTESVDMSTRVVVGKVVRFSAVFLAILVALPMVGIDLTTLSIFGGALGVGLGFGLQKIAANYVSGFIVLLDRSLRIGDIVTVDGRKGEVREIASRYTVIRGAEGLETIVPNEKLISESVSHHTYSVPRLSTALPFVIDAGSDTERALEILLEAARAEGMLAQPAAVARVKGLPDYGIELELVAWFENPGRGEADVRSALYRHVLRRFREEGIRISVPRRDPLALATPETGKDS